MPVLDAKALETDPEGMAFLRAVLKPAGGQKGAASGAARPEPNPAFAVPLKAECPRRPRPRKAAPAPAA